MLLLIKMRLTILLLRHVTLCTFLEVVRIHLLRINILLIFLYRFLCELLLVHKLIWILLYNWNLLWLLYKVLLYVQWLSMVLQFIVINRILEILIWNYRKVQVFRLIFLCLLYERELVWNITEPLPFILNLIIFICLSFFLIDRW